MLAATTAATAAAWGLFAWRRIVVGSQHVNTTANVSALPVVRDDIKMPSVVQIGPVDPVAAKESESFSRDFYPESLT